MKLIDKLTVELPGESVVKRMQDISSNAIESLRAATIETFHLLWDDRSSRQDKLDRMGSRAVPAFIQHAMTIEFLLRSGIQIDPRDYTPPMSYSLNEDGTITLKEVIDPIELEQIAVEEAERIAQEEAQRNAEEHVANP